MTSTLAPATQHPGCCWLLAPLTWPTAAPAGRQLHRLLGSLADLLDAVGAAHRLATELAALAEPPAQGWEPALKAIDAAAVGATDTCWLIRLLIDHNLHEAAELLRQGLDHRTQALQRLRRAIRTEQFAPLDPQHMGGLLAAVTYRLDQAGRSLATADHTVITAAWKECL